MWSRLSVVCLVFIAWSCAGKTERAEPPSASGQGGAATPGGGTATGGLAGDGPTAGRASSSGGASSSGSAGTSASGASGSGAGGASTGGADGGMAGNGGGAGECTVGGTPDAGVQAAVAGSCIVAVVRVTRRDEECSGLGGVHITFEIIEFGRGSGIMVPSAGGHGYRGSEQVGDLFVAGIDALDPPVDRTNAGWCITGLPLTDGNAHTLLAAASEQDARAQMQAILN